MILSIIVAASRNNVIGRDNGLPWRLPEDLRHFKQLTMGKPLIMGRRTFDSIGRPLPGRTMLVVTRQPGWHRDGVIVCASPAEAIARAETLLQPGQEEVMVAGGEEIYRQCLPRVDRIYLTRVDVDVDGDARFPDIDGDQWRTVEDSGNYSEGAGLYYRFMTLEKKATSVGV